MPVGALVNDYLSILGELTFWHTLLRELPGLQDWTGVPYPELADAAERRFYEVEGDVDCPQYLIRNASYFRPLRVPVPQIVLLQDIFSGGIGRDMQLSVAGQAARVVCNSPYTASFYPELSETACILPIPVDPTQFPVSAKADRSTHSSELTVCWVGAASSIKGWDTLHAVIEQTPFRFVVVTKDSATITHPRVTSVPCVPQEVLWQIYANADIGLCTSRHETQHLAGIEMGYTGLPLVTTEVGAYFNRPPGVWGTSGPAETLAARLLQMSDKALPSPSEVRRYWTDEFSPAAIVAQWRQLVEEVTACTP